MASCSVRADVLSGDLGGCQKTSPGRLDGLWGSRMGHPPTSPKDRVVRPDGPGRQGGPHRPLTQAPPPLCRGLSWETPPVGTSLEPGEWGVAGCSPLGIKAGIALAAWQDVEGVARLPGSLCACRPGAGESPSMGPEATPRTVGHLPTASPGPHKSWHLWARVGQAPL